MANSYIKLTDIPVTDSITLNSKLLSIETDLNLTQLITAEDLTIYLSNTALYKGQINTMYDLANTAYSLSNAAYDQTNTISVILSSSYDTANTISDQINVSFELANTVYDKLMLLVKLRIVFTEFLILFMILPTQQILQQILQIQLQLEQ